jgi:hypothetical protein
MSSPASHARAQVERARRCRAWSRGRRRRRSLGVRTESWRRLRRRRRRRRRRLGGSMRSQKRCCGMKKGRPAHTQFGSRGWNTGGHGQNPRSKWRKRAADDDGGREAGGLAGQAFVFLRPRKRPRSHTTQAWGTAVGGVGRRGKKGLPSSLLGGLASPLLSLSVGCDGGWVGWQAGSQTENRTPVTSVWSFEVA